jgi:hypothetical protein
MTERKRSNLELELGWAGAPIYRAGTPIPDHLT